MRWKPSASMAGLRMAILGCCRITALGSRAFGSPQMKAAFCLNHHMELTGAQRRALKPNAEASRWDLRCSSLSSCPANGELFASDNPPWFWLVKHLFCMMPCCRSAQQ
ncbi:hypothetical protein V8C34DRAFT_19923 [Trichoderma compactum]